MIKLELSFDTYSIISSTIPVRNNFCLYTDYQRIPFD